MTIKYYRKNVYGNELMYLTGNDRGEIAKALFLISSHVTLTKDTMRGLQYFGVEFEEVITPSDHKDNGHGFCSVPGCKVKHQ